MGYDPILTYDCEAWNLSRDSFEKLASFEFNDYWRMLMVSCTTYTTNAEILDRVVLSLPTLVAHYQRRKLCYFGHVMRHEGIDRTIVDGVVPGKRRQGGQRKQWSDDLKSRLSCGFADACRFAQDRASFRQVVRKAAQGPRLKGTLIRTHGRCMK